MNNYQVRVGQEYVDDDGYEADLPGRGWEHAQTGTCPDCGGTWVWAEAGYVPGTRECRDCGSLFSVQGTRERWYLRRERHY